MSCSERYDSLMQYAYGELGTGAASELESHLAECENCRRRLEALQSMDASLRGSLSEPEESPDMTSTILAALPRQPRPSPLRWLLASGFVAAAALLLVWLNLPVQHGPAQQVKLPEKVVRSRTQSIPPAPKQEVREQGVDGEPETTWAAVSPVSPKLPSTTRRLRPAAAAAKPVTPDQKERVATPDAVANTDDVITVRIDPPVVVVDQSGTRSRVTISAKVCGVEVTHAMETVTVPPPPNPDAESIQRPELKTVSTGLFGRLNS